jgi:hypothetical protein
VRYRSLIGLVLVLGSFFVAFWAAELLDGRLPFKRGSIGFMAAGLTMLAGDVGARKYGGEGEGFGRYVRGPSLRGVPVFVFGLGLMFLSVWMRNK